MYVLKKNQYSVLSNRITKMTRKIRTIHLFRSLVMQPNSNGKTPMKHLQVTRMLKNTVETSQHPII